MISKGEASPRLWIVAGPNGSGKSTAYSRSDVSEFDGSVWIINPDLLTRRLRLVEDLHGEEANLAAVTRIEAWLKASVAVHQTIGVETVLSTSKYRPLVRDARRRGFEICLIYIYVDRLERQLQRIRLRVAKGGHDVPEDKVAARRARSFGEFPWFFWQADRAWVYDNSRAEPLLVALKEQPGLATLGAELLPELRAGLSERHSCD
ncbi:MAG: AAA family ATPase [Alphaproteobacteria bacterium]|nr:AAA family ATPase [Alphaproteobacteria bacterium]MBV9372789.1 AAA family ATPase [Alphaproteobacteria bacterium]MBV9900516.1 AAA family ATPase [Alphaproteobacteria bacterium]